MTRRKETFKNKAILFQFLLFPVLTPIMESAIKIENMPEHFFVKLFAVMFVDMAPLTCMSSIILEKKEKNTLRVLMMSNVKPMQYLLCVYVWIMCMVGTVIFAIYGKYSNDDFTSLFLIMAFGILLSILSEAIIGICCKSQMTATSITVPVMMVFSLLIVNLFIAILFFFIAYKNKGLE